MTCFLVITVRTSENKLIWGDLGMASALVINTEQEDVDSFLNEWMHAMSAWMPDKKIHLEVRKMSDISQTASLVADIHSDTKEVKFY
jgi:hypothetical protein